MAEPNLYQPSAADGPVPRPEREGWRAKLPKIPDPIEVDLPVRGRTAFMGWLGLSMGLIIVGVFLNWWLTGGQWILQSQSFDNPQNPFGETQVQFLTTHPYDLLTASLFVVSTVLLGLSLLRPKKGEPGYGWWQLYQPIGTFFGKYRHPIRAAGWTLFAFHWAATALNFFVVEGGDWVNMIFAFASVFVLTYFAYQEFVSQRLGEDNPSLRFAAGAVFLAATVWYAFLRVEFLSQWIIEVVTDHTVWLLHALGQEVAVSTDGRTGFMSAITYPDQQMWFQQRIVIIILACTAIQSMMIFVSAALAVPNAAWRRRAIVMAVTVPLVYFLNLWRNVLIIWMWQTRWLERNFGVSPDAAFGIAHNWIGKVGSLAALIIIALFVFRVLPEVVHAIIGLLDLPRRRGPLEQFGVALPAGSVYRGGGIAVALGGIVWAFFDPLNGGLVVASGIVIFYLGLQKAKRSRDQEAAKSADAEPQPVEA